MRHPWWFQRFPADDNDDENRQRGRAAHPSARRWLDDDPCGQPVRPRRLSLDEGDWREIEALLVSQPDGSPGAQSSEPLDSLVASLHTLRSFADSEITGVDPVTNQLLDVWAIARDIGPQVARPAETLLLALVGRDLVNFAEIVAVCNETQAALGSLQR